jgi:hypothetical protein
MRTFLLVLLLCAGCADESPAQGACGVPAPATPGWSCVEGTWIAPGPWCADVIASGERVCWDEWSECLAAREGTDALSYCYQGPVSVAD